MLSQSAKIALGISKFCFWNCKAPSSTFGGCTPRLTPYGKGCSTIWVWCFGALCPLAPEIALLLKNPLSLTSRQHRLAVLFKSAKEILVKDPYMEYSTEFSKRTARGDSFLVNAKMTPILQDKMASLEQLLDPWVRNFLLQRFERSLVLETSMKVVLDLKTVGEFSWTFWSILIYKASAQDCYHIPIPPPFPHHLFIQSFLFIW